jgi:tetratricopeptide (TPR) repeat protein
MENVMKKHFFYLLSALLLAALSLPAQQIQIQPSTPAGPPLTEKEVIKGLKAKSNDIIPQITEKGVDFEVTPEIEKQLRKAKADDAVMDLIRKATPSARAAAAKEANAKPGIKVTAEEYQAYKAVASELDPDKDLALVNDFATKYPNSSLLSFVYTFASNAYQQKQDVDDMVVYARKSVTLNPQNMAALITLASTLPLPQYLKNHEQDKDKVLTDAENDANSAMKLLDTIPRMQNESDDSYAARKKQLKSELYSSIAMVHLQRSEMGLMGPDKDELAKAEQNYNEAISGADKPNAQDYFRLGEAYRMDGKIDDAIQAFTKAGEMNDQIKAFSDKQIADLQKAKAGQKK